MSNDLVLIISMAVPALAIVLLRSNAAMVFLSLCLGAVLVDHVAPSADELMHIISRSANEVSNSVVSLALLLAPAVVTSTVTLLSLHGRLRVACNVLPAIAASMLAGLLAIPVLPKHLSGPLQTGEAWHILSRSEALVVGAGALISLFFLWSQRRNFKLHDKKHH